MVLARGRRGLCDAFAWRESRRGVVRCCSEDSDESMDSCLTTHDANEYGYHGNQPKNKQTRTEAALEVGECGSRGDVAPLPLLARVAASVVAFSDARR